MINFTGGKRWLKIGWLMYELNPRENVQLMFAFKNSRFLKLSFFKFVNKMEHKFKFGVILEDNLTETFYKLGQFYENLSSVWGTGFEEAQSCF